MRLFKTAKLSSPPLNDGWDKIEFGMSVVEVRILTYASIILFLAINAVGLLALGETYSQQFSSAIEAFGRIGFILLVVLTLFVYQVVHEFIHILYFPDQWRSKDTFLGFLKGAAIFVLYNAPISVKRMKQCYMGPLLWLNIPFIALAVLYPGVLTFNMLLVHLFSCAGDISFRLKIGQFENNSLVWSEVTSFWVKHK